jgi:hypothetical protein
MNSNGFALPISFAALQATTKVYEQSLVADHQFAAVIVGADRCAVIGALAHLDKLLGKSIAIEPHGYRPAINDVHRLALINTIFSISTTFIASIQAVEFSEGNDMERFVGGLLSMARGISELERDVELVLAKETIVEKTITIPLPQPSTKAVRKRGS